jgi:hypothetical protein
LTYKQKLTYVLILGGLFAVILYNMAISGTIDLAVENSELELLVSKNVDAPLQIKAVKQKLSKIEQLIGNEVNASIDIHQLLLGSVSGYVQENNLILKDFPQPYSMTDKGYITKTAIVTVEGDFISLLNLCNYIEKKYQVGKIVAIDFKATKELRTKKRKLNSTIYLQNVKAEEDENI